METGSARGGAASTVAGAKQVGGQLVGQPRQAGEHRLVVFDRGGFSYHGRIAAIADGTPAKPDSKF